MSRRDKLVAAGLLGVLVAVTLPQAVNLYDLLKDKLSASKTHLSPDGNGRP